MKNEIYQRIRGPIKREIGTFYPQNGKLPIKITNEERGVIGLLFAYKDENNKVHITWSLVNPVDKFDLEIGQQICRNKNRSDQKVPHKIVPFLKQFTDRAKRYFKDGIFD